MIRQSMLTRQISSTWRLDSRPESHEIEQQTMEALGTIDDNSVEGVKY
jgi:hypothetical protein